MKDEVHHASISERGSLFPQKERRSPGLGNIYSFAHAVRNEQRTLLLKASEMAMIDSTSEAHMNKHDHVDGL